MRSLLLVALIVAVTCLPRAEKWAVLVSGSKGYWNYRHQADVCHSYRVLINRGFNPKHIILFSYDDVANHPDNPYPGKLYNRPDRPGHPAIDVNKGCKKDYTGNDVTPNNFFNVLSGNSGAMGGIGTGRVLKSDKYDNVFIFFTDHGGTGLIAFPNELMSADLLLSAFQNMYNHHMYKKMVIYLEACESGSMFEGLLNPVWNILAVTASNSHQSSYATYCPPDDVVDGVHIGACLGDEFSVNWMEDSDKMIVGETLLEQFITVYVDTDFSEVSMYGDTGFILNTVGSFIGNPKFSIFPFPYLESIVASAWSSRDGGLVSMLATYVNDPSERTSNILISTISGRERARKVFTTFSEELNDCSKDAIIEGNLAPKNFKCLNAGVKAYESFCGAFDEYSLSFVKYIVNACESKVSISRIQTAFRQICRPAVINSRFESEPEQVPDSEIEYEIESETDSEIEYEIESESYTLIKSMLSH
jgi:legumain